MLQGKLIKLFSNQLVTKMKMRSNDKPHLPSLTQWLKVVGLSAMSINVLCQKIHSFEELQEKSEHELKTILNDRGARPEELSRLCKALHNLKKYTGKRRIFSHHRSMLFFIFPTQISDWHCKYV